jgi:hypothetical protein
MAGRCKKPYILLILIAVISVAIKLITYRPILIENGIHHSNTAAMLTSAVISYTENPINTKFLQILNFKSVEYENGDVNIHIRHIGNLTWPVYFNNRLNEVYASYPYGSIAPIIFVSYLTSIKPNIYSIYFINAILIIIILYYMHRIMLHYGIGNNITLFTLSCFSLNIIAQYYYHIFYMMHTLGVCLYVIYLHYSVVDINKNKKIFLIFIGLLTDWLFFFILLYDFFANIKDKKYLYKLSLFATVAILTFIAQIFYVVGFEAIKWKILHHIGLSNDAGFGVSNGWIMPKYPIYVYLYTITKNAFELHNIFLILSIFSIKKIIEKKLLIFIIPSTLYLIVLRASSFHSYEIIKFFPITLILSAYTLKNYLNKKILLVLIFISNIFIYAYLFHYKYNYNINYSDYVIDNFISGQEYDSIIFEEREKQKIWGAYSFNVAPYMNWVENYNRQKPTIKFQKISEVENYIAKINVNYKKVIIITNEPLDNTKSNYIFENFIAGKYIYKLKI